MDRAVPVARHRKHRNNNLNDAVDCGLYVGILSRTFVSPTNARLANRTFQEEHLGVHTILSQAFWLPDRLAKGLE
ncbi:hypothetical protein MTYM_01837 [Methylococcales bacterium]|nr:hypothetical protein MTYM_01837 [Methylococcales bacterium]